MAVVLTAGFAETGTDHADVETQGLRLFVECNDTGGTGETVTFDGGQYITVTIAGLEAP